MHSLCPRCGLERNGAFRFCRSCRFEFDAPGADQVAPPFDRPQPAAGVAHELAATGNRWATARGVLVLLFAVAVGIGGLSTAAMPELDSPSSAPSSAAATPASEQPVANAPDATPGSTLAATADLGAGPSGTTTEARVVRVIDGDTILVAFGGERHKVQYLGMSTAATVGRRATATNAALVAGRTVVLEADVSQADGSGRLLRYVWVQQGSTWTLVNLKLVRLGLGTVSIDSPDRKYADRYVAAEAHARARHLGLWGPGPKAKPPKPSKPPKPPKASTPPVSPSPPDRR